MYYIPTPHYNFVMFKIDTISKREGRGGFDGLRYSNRPATQVSPESMELPDPTFGAKVFKTMADNDRITFEEEVIERGRFLDAKRSLAGERNVEEFEDRDVLSFDPVSQYQQNKVGAMSHDSGKYQGGESGESFVKGRGEHAEGRFTTLQQPNPYHTKLSNKIKIRQ